MNYFKVILVLLCFSFSAQGQTESKNKDLHFGIAINSGYALSALEININPTGTFYINQHEIELGFGLYPFKNSNSHDQDIWSTQLNYKYYPSGIEKRLNLYLTTSLTYTYKTDETIFVNDLVLPHEYTYYLHKINYLSLMGGYGIDLRIFKNGYIGTSMYFGGSTRSETSKLYSVKLFEEFGVDAAICMKIGYRF